MVRAGTVELLAIRVPQDRLDASWRGVDRVQPMLSWSPSDCRTLLSLLRPPPPSLHRPPRAPTVHHAILHCLSSTEPARSRQNEPSSSMPTLSHPRQLSKPVAYVQAPSTSPQHYPVTRLCAPPRPPPSTVDRRPSSRIDTNILQFVRGVGRQSKRRGTMGSVVAQYSSEESLGLRGGVEGAEGRGGREGVYLARSWRGVCAFARAMITRKASIRGG